LAASTPEWLSRATKQHHLGGGFYPRWLLFYCGDAPDYTLTHRDPPGASQLPYCLDQLATMPGPGEKVFSDEAKDYYHHWYLRLVESKTDEMAAWLERLAVYARKISLLYEASTTNHHEISVENVRLACGLVDRIAKDTALVLREELAFSAPERLAKRVYKFIRERGPNVAWGKLCAQFHRESAGTLRTCVETLEQQERIIFNEGPQGGKHYSVREEPKHD
jgi:hypothetical protein